MQSLINKLFNGDAPAECEKLIGPAPYERHAKLDEAEKREVRLINALNEEQKSFSTNGKARKPTFGATR